jgi:hypothetical protein
LPDAGISVPFLEDFGKPVRESACECERSSGMVLGPILKLINGPTVAEALTDQNSALNQLAAKEKDDGKLIEEVFVRFLSRKPTANELKLGVETLKAAAEDHAKALEALAEYEKQLGEKQAAWEASQGKPIVWRALEATELKSAAGATLTKQDDQSIVASGTLAKDTYTITANVDLPGITGLKLEAIADPSLPGGGPGRAQNGNFVVGELKVTFAAKGNQSPPVAVVLENGTADFSQSNFSPAGAVDGNDQTGWAISPQFGKSHEAVFEVKENEALKGAGIVTITLSQQYKDGKHLLGKFRLSVTDGERPLNKEKLPEAVAAGLAVPKDQRSAEQAAAVTDYFKSLDAEWTRLSAMAKSAGDQMKNARALGIQDLGWALINSPAFLFNR